ncbi:MAG: preprotein translocase subunit SecG [Spirochaetaceae bacterium]|jgi:preprotein translocase subunit SecG|nr:preprotein translocase subunit SecG [Spirochaetaceae bacterium]
MTILRAALLVVFIIVALLLVLLVLVQNEEGDSLGGIFAGGSASAFGSRTGNVLTRATSVLGALFLIISFGLALVNRSSGGSGVEAAGAKVRQQATEGNQNWWQEDETPPVIPESPVPEAPSAIEAENPISEQTKGD